MLQNPWPGSLKFSAYQRNNKTQRQTVNSKIENENKNKIC